MLESRIFAPARGVVRMRAVDVTSRAAATSCMVIAPHPDDETLGCGATIARKRAAGKDVRVVIVTDGRRSHRSAKISGDRLAELRREEAIAACGVLGIAKSDVIFLDVEDQTVGVQRAEVSRRLAALIDQAAPDEVYSPYGLDGHVDHRALGGITRDLVATGKVRCRVLEYPVWFWTLRTFMERGPVTAVSMTKLLAAPLRAAWLRSPRIVRTGTFLEIKRKALAKHRSQLENLTGEANWNTLDPQFLRDFFRSYELFFEFGAGEEPRESGR